MVVRTPESKHDLSVGSLDFSLGWNKIAYHEFSIGAKYWLERLVWWGSPADSQVRLPI